MAAVVRAVELASGGAEEAYDTAAESGRGGITSPRRR
jgi:hypothetical protein